MSPFADVYRALNSLVDEGVVKGFAVAGAHGAFFYIEPAVTYDIDIFVMIEQKSFLVDLSAIYAWAKSHGYPAEAEHIMVLGVPVQILDAGGGIELDAVKDATFIEYEEVLVPVFKPEYLAVIAAKVGGGKRRIRALEILDKCELDMDLINRIVAKYKLQEVWNKLLTLR